MADPRTLWPDLTDWEPAGMAEQVFRVRTTAGERLYVRPDDNSSDLLNHLSLALALPTPRVLDRRHGWLLLSALPGIPLHDSLWHARAGDVAGIVATALRALEDADVTHGDLCLPNILGDPESGELSGIVDWRYAGVHLREVDVAAAVWSCHFNGYGDDIAVDVLARAGWRPADRDEVLRLRDVWTDLSPADDRLG
jgi:aminoglycoside phosphotransferase